MKKNVVVMTIIGMLMLSSFMITPVLADETGIIISDEKPEDGATDVSILLSELSFQLNESYGNPMGYTVGTNPDIGGDSGFVDGNATCFVSVSGLDWNTVYTWYVNATIARGDYKNETFSFTTESRPPVADFTNITHGLKVEFNGSLSNDPDGDITNYAWYFGDGNISSGEDLEYVEHTYGEDGVYYVSLNVTDNGGKTDNITKTITVKNAAPVVDFDPSVDGKEVKFTSLSHDVDGTIENYIWYFGDGTISSGEDLDYVEHTYAEEHKTYEVTLNVTDNMGLQNETSKDVTTDDTTDIIEPTIEIVKPERALYIRNQKIRPFLFRMACIIGDITIKVNATDEDSGIEKVEFIIKSIDGEVKNTSYERNKDDGLYSYTWTRDGIRFFHIHRLTVKAYDKAGNMAEAKMIVRKLL